MSEAFDRLRAERPDRPTIFPFRDFVGAFLQLPDFPQYFPHGADDAWIEISVLAPVPPSTEIRVVVALPVEDPDRYRAALAARPGYDEIGGNDAFRHYRAYTTDPPGDWHLAEAAGGVMVFSRHRTATSAIKGVYDELARPAAGRWPTISAPREAGDRLTRRLSNTTLREGDLRIRLWAGPWLDQPTADDPRPGGWLDAGLSALREAWAHDGGEFTHPDASRRLAAHVTGGLSALLRQRVHRVEWAARFDDDAIRFTVNGRFRPADGGGVSTATPSESTTGEAWIRLLDAWTESARRTARPVDTLAPSADEARALARCLPENVVAFHALAPTGEAWRTYAALAGGLMAEGMGAALSPAARDEFDVARRAWLYARPGALAVGWTSTGAQGADGTVAFAWRFEDPSAATLAARATWLWRAQGPAAEWIASSERTLSWRRDDRTLPDGQRVFGARMGWGTMRGARARMPSMAEQAEGRVASTATGRRWLGVWRAPVWYGVVARERADPDEEAAADRERLAMLASMVAGGGREPSVVTAAWTFPAISSTRPPANRCAGWWGVRPWASGLLALARETDWTPLGPDDPPPARWLDRTAWLRYAPEGSGTDLPEVWAGRWGPGSDGTDFGWDGVVPWASLFTLADAMGLTSR